jgi:hypothetical protein
MNELIPKHKDDFSPFEKLKNHSIEEIRPIIMDILYWLKDGNWPISSAVADLFEDKIDQIESEIIQILKSSDDEIWKYWVISRLLFQPDSTLPKSILNELTRIKTNPTIEEKREEVNLVAEEALECQTGF